MANEDDGNDPIQPEILASIDYLRALIDQELKAKVEAEGIVTGGFSKDSAIAFTHCGIWK
jgi:hypothetical protein